MVVSWGMPFISQAKSPDPTRGWGSLTGGLGVGPPGSGGTAGLCRAVPCCAMPVPVPVLVLGKPGFLLLSASSQTCLLQCGGFCPRQWPPARMGWPAFCHPACAPTRPLSTRMAAL